MQFPQTVESISDDEPPKNLRSLRMLLIPGGVLLKDGENITIEPFMMSQTLITQAQWWVIAQRTDLRIARNLELTPSRFTDDYQGTSHWLRPIDRVSWDDAIEFCGQLSKLTQFSFCLPAELQWIYGCHGLRYPPYSGKYPPFHYGETLTGELANYDSSYTFADEKSMTSPKQTTPVGNYPPNQFGLQDMHGNLWEWNFNLYKK